VSGIILIIIATVGWAKDKGIKMPFGGDSDDAKKTGVKAVQQAAEDEQEAKTLEKHEELWKKIDARLRALTPQAVSSLAEQQQMVTTLADEIKELEEIDKELAELIRQSKL